MVFRYALSKVTQYVQDVYERLQQGTKNTEPQSSATKKELEFEHLGDTCIPSSNGPYTGPPLIVVL